MHAWLKRIPKHGPFSDSEPAQKYSIDKEYATFESQSNVDKLSVFRTHFGVRLGFVRTLSTLLMNKVTLFMLGNASVIIVEVSQF